MNSFRALIRDLNRALDSDLTRALALASDLTRALNRERVLTVALRDLGLVDRELELGRARARERTLESERDRARVGTLTSALTQALDIARALNLDHDLDRESLSVLTHDLARDVEIARVRAITLARDLDVIRVRALARDLDIVRVRALALALADVLAKSHRAVRSFEALARNPEGSDRSVAVVSRRSRAAEWIVRWAAQVVPPGHRSRYESEFRGDLAAMAEEGGGRRTQLACAVRMLSQVLALRAILRDVPPELPERAGPS